MSVETTGADARYWLADPRNTRTEDKTSWWLYKDVKMGRLKGHGGVMAGTYRRADDRVEKIANGLAELVGLPSAQIELVERNGVEGLISLNVASGGWTLQPGDIMLAEHKGYVSCAGENRKMKDRPGHSIANIANLLEPMLGPPDTPVADWLAFDVFAGYLIFDAWIANTDRHAFNWAVLLSDNGFRLAPSFDHGSALGSGLIIDPARELTPDEVGSWCSRGRARRFEAGARRSLVDVASQALTQASPQAADWVGRLGAVTRPEWQAVVDRVPGVSEAESRFIDRVLEENQRRVCDECDSASSA